MTFANKKTTPETVPPLTRVELDAMGCQTPGCTHQHDHTPMFLHARCHMDSGVTVQYFDGALTINCAKCKAFICRVAVAAVAADPNQQLAKNVITETFAECMANEPIGVGLPFLDEVPAC
jgi:hypothetical protein